MAMTQYEICGKLRALADGIDEVSVNMDYYGGFAPWACHGREIAGAGAILRQWANDIQKSPDSIVLNGIDNKLKRGDKMTREEQEVAKEIISKYMSENGKKGGSKKSPLKTLACRANGRLGGRPRKDREIGK